MMAGEAVAAQGQSGGMAGMGSMMGMSQLMTRSVGQTGQTPGQAPMAAADGRSGGGRRNAPIIVAIQGGGMVNFQAGTPRQLQSNVRQIGSKTFYFKENRWIDSVVKPEEEAKATIVRQFSDKFFELARSQSSELNQYLTFTEPVTLKLAGTVYRIDPAESRP